MKHPIPVKPGLHSEKKPFLNYWYIIFPRTYRVFIIIINKGIDINIIIVDRKKTRTDAVVFSTIPLVAITTSMYVLLRTVERTIIEESSK